MSTKIILTGLAVALISACSLKPNSRSFMEGVYVNNQGGKYSCANDTLIIEASENNNYLIHRKTGYNLIRQGRTGKRQYEKEEWYGLYDHGTRAITEMKKHRLLTFYPEAGEMQVNGRTYKKIN